MKRMEFDVALVGAGGYGYPLVAYAKELGRQGNLTGDMLQLYFGIKSKNWDDKGYYNEHWTRYRKKEIPKGYKRVEDERYW